MTKSVEAFRTISEVSEELDVPQHVLRFWETKFSQLRPVKRGGGRRYYRPEDLALLRGVRHMLHVEGYSIRGAQKFLREQGARAVIGVGEAHQAPLVEAIANQAAADAEDEAAPEKKQPPIDVAPPDLSPRARARLEGALEALLKARAALESARG